MVKDINSAKKQLFSNFNHSGSYLKLFSMIDVNYISIKCTLFMLCRRILFKIFIIVLYSDYIGSNISICINYH